MVTQISQSQSPKSQSAVKQAKAAKTAKTTDVEKKQNGLEQIGLGFEVKDEGDIAAVLSLSMPKTAKYPDAFFGALSGLPEDALFAIVNRPEGAHARFIKEIQKKNRKAWSRMDRDQRNGNDDAATREATRLRRRWFVEELAKCCEENEREMHMHKR